MSKKNENKKQNNGEKVYNVRIVEDSTKKLLSKKQVFSILVLSLAFYFIFNLKILLESIFVNYNFWDVFTETFKELIYSTGLSVFVFFVVYFSPVANKKEM